jgi:hypothetical protein
MSKKLGAVQMPMLASAALTLARLRIVIFPLRVFITVFSSSHLFAIFHTILYLHNDSCFVCGKWQGIGRSCEKGEMPKALIRG